MLSEIVTGDPEDPKFHRFVGLDLSLRRTGFCALNYEGGVEWARCEGYSLKRDASQREQAERWFYITKFILEGIEQNSFSVVDPKATSQEPWKIYPRVAIEGYPYGKASPRKGPPGSGEKQASVGGAIYDLGELGGFVKGHLILDLNIAAYIVPPSQARKAEMGTGRASKQQVIKHANENGCTTTNEHIADAFVTARWLWRQKRESDNG